MADSPDRTRQDETLALLTSLGFVTDDTQADRYREQLAKAERRRTPEYWAALRERIGPPARTA